MKRIALLACLLAGSTLAADGPSKTTLYKSVGPDGRAVYADRPPGAGQLSEKMTFENLPSSPLSASTLAYIEQLRKSADAAPAANAPQGDVVLFSAIWCGYCTKAKAYLAGKAIAYREVDIDTSAGALAYAHAGGQRGVPLLIARGKRVIGFSAAAYDAVLSQQK